MSSLCLPENSAVAKFVASDSQGIGMVPLSAYKKCPSKGLNIKVLKINGTRHGNENYLLQ